MKELPYVHVRPGPIGHVGHPDEKMQDEVNMKTFLDFYMISMADKVYLGISGEMYNSNYARTAALIGGRSFEIIRY